SATGTSLAAPLCRPMVEPSVEPVGWRQACVGVGGFCLVWMLPLARRLRRRTPAALRGAALPGRRAEARVGEPAATEQPSGSTAGGPSVTAAAATGPQAALGLSPAALQTLLCIAGVACCVAMSMPQVHIVAYCGDLGYGPARGAQMLSLMFGFGIV